MQKIIGIPLGVMLIPRYCFTNQQVLALIAGHKTHHSFPAVPHSAVFCLGESYMWLGQTAANHPRRTGTVYYRADGDNPEMDRWLDQGQRYWRPAFAMKKDLCRYRIYIEASCGIVEARKMTPAMLVEEGLVFSDTPEAKELWAIELEERKILDRKQRPLVANPTMYRYKISYALYKAPDACNHRIP